MLSYIPYYIYTCIYCIINYYIKYIAIIYHNIESIIFVYVHIMGKKNKLEGHTQTSKTDSLWDIGFNRYGGSFILAKKMGKKIVVDY